MRHHVPHGHQPLDLPAIRPTSNPTNPPAHQIYQPFDLPAIRPTIEPPNRSTGGDRMLSWSSASTVVSIVNRSQLKLIAVWRQSSNVGVRSGNGSDVSPVMESKATKRCVSRERRDIAGCGEKGKRWWVRSRQLQMVNVCHVDHLTDRRRLNETITNEEMKKSSFNWSSPTILTASTNEFLEAN